MTRQEMENEIAFVLCGKDKNITCNECKKTSNKDICKNWDKCRIAEKSEEQLQYVLSPIDTNTFLKACAGSGKTEVVGMKSAYEIKKWNKSVNTGINGIAILTFTNNATDVIKDRIQQFNNFSSTYPHFIGTLSSFIHQYIAQPYGYKSINKIAQIKKCKNKINEDEDCSLRIVDKDVKEKWLSNFSTYSKYNNEYYYDFKSKALFFNNSRNKDISFEELFKSKEFSKFLNNLIDSLKEKKKSYDYLKYDYINNRMIKEKFEFHCKRFANYEDINNIAYCVLLNKNICRKLSLKFPLIIIDECQDLSWIEIQILKKLKDEGSVIHFVGDINQSIYSFKNVYPEDLQEFICDFDTKELSRNFRSCGDIVKFSNKLVPNCENIKSNCEKPKITCEPLLYIEYDKSEDEAVKKYNQIISLVNGLNKEKCCIIARQNTVIDNLINCANEDIVDGVYLWTKESPSKKKKALEIVGKHIAKLFGGGMTKNNYYCPKDIISVFQWRIFLKEVLNILILNEKLFEFKNYGDWYKEFRNVIEDIIKDKYKILESYDDNKTREFNFKNKFKSPNGKANKTIVFKDNSHNLIECTTIHKSKGCTYDSTLVISSKSNKSDGGYWEQWLKENQNQEYNRVAYVASTRAKYQLVWAVPKLTNEDRKLLESYGFKNAVDINSEKIFNY